MPKMIQIRHVPEGTHRELKARAAAAGMSLSDYLLAELRKTLQRPTADELRRRLQTRDPAEVSPPPSEAVRAERDSR